MQMLYFVFPFCSTGGCKLKVNPGAVHVEAHTKKTKCKLSPDMKQGWIRERVGECSSFWPL